MLRTKEIIDSLAQSHWRNWWDWSYEKCRDYIKNNFDCSPSVRRKVAKEIVNWR